VSERTVRYHMAGIMDPLHLEHRSQVIAYGAKWSWGPRRAEPPPTAPFWFIALDDAPLTLPAAHPVTSDSLRIAADCRFFAAIDIA
jgi:hypothetical protein